tara:strand:+ start:3753 stop:5312 length:1560 start_codon:yes stop_codon:yes gene_type:complete
MKVWISLFLIVTTCLGSETRFYEQVGLGESDLPAYSGPLDPRMEYTLSSGALHFSDDLFSENYLAPVTSPAIFDLEEIWFEKLPSQSACPNSYLAENIDYIRYLYRLLTLSYLYESFKDYQETLYGFGKSSQTCSISYDLLFKKCSANESEMKKFIARARSVVTKDLTARSLERFGNKQSNNWLARVRNTREELTPAQSRVRGICEGSKSGCDTLSEKEVIAGLTEACSQDKQLFYQVCSESDQLHGLSKIPELVPVLASSNVLKVINAGGHGEACLGRYARLLAIRERWHPPLKWIMPAVKSKLTFGDARYPQGVLFLPGALREFDERGLGDFLFAEPTPVVTPTAVPMVAILPRPTPIPTPIVLPKTELKPPVVVVTPKPTPTPVPLSAFEYAYKIHRNGFEPIDVDMIRFSSEGRFSARVVEKLADALKQYQTRKALQDMKVADELGTLREPVRLMFLKFLIDQDQHQGLWNIVNVIGEEFYVINDLDGVRIPVWIKLRNDRSTAFAWQITIIAKK